MPWKVGGWVLVEYDGHNYPGCIQQVEQHDIEVSCMQPSGPNWKWPEGKGDIAWYSLNKVIKALSPPVPALAVRDEISRFLDL